MHSENTYPDLDVNAPSVKEALVTLAAQGLAMGYMLRGIAMLRTESQNLYG